MAFILPEATGPERDDWTSMGSRGSTKFRRTHPCGHRNTALMCPRTRSLPMPLTISPIQASRVS